MPQVAFANRMNEVHRSYIREILKVTARPEVISFAGGLPNPACFPTQGVHRAADHVLREAGAEALQYATTEGFPPLREFIAARYRDKYGMDVSPDQITVTTGSQQALDLAAKVLINRGDPVIIERPGYLGAIQAFSVLGARFVPVELLTDGLDPEMFARRVKETGARLLYAVTSFQNPSGLTYSAARRAEIAAIARENRMIVVEDNPYGELRFRGEDVAPLAAFYPEGTILLGSFSKVVAPGLRVGWMAAPGEIAAKLVTAKQAADLHTSSLTQRIIHRFVTSEDLSGHIESIRAAYGAQRDRMLARARELFPAEVAVTEPEGGMFLWATLPGGVSAAKLFDKAIAHNVAFVPSAPFYTDGTDNAMRLNFSNSSIEKIDEGMARLARCLREELASAG